MSENPLITQSFVGTGIIPTGSVGVSQLFGYDIAKHDARRPHTPPILRSEDWELDAPRRRIAVTSARDIYRNFAIVGWAVRKHVDYISRFSFKCKIGDQELDKRYADKLDEKTSEQLNNLIEELIWEWGKPGNFEITGRYSINQFMRLAEIARVIDGDIGVLKLSDGMVQAVEGDRIRSDYGSYCNEWIQGVKVDSVGRPLEYKIWKRVGRGGGSFEFEKDVPAENMILHGYFNRFDQIRGIAPIVPAVQTLCDVYQGFDYALLKAKLSQMLGYKFTIDPNSPFDSSSLTQEEIDGTTKYRSQILKDKASFFVELKEGENMEMVSGNTPSTEFQAYSRLMIMVALKAFDIPYGMFDETQGTFYGNRSGIVQYIESTQQKRADNVHLLNLLTRWRLAYEVLRGRLKLPAGMTVDDIYFVWTPNGLPWWDAEKESKGLFATVQYGMASLTETCQLLGKDFKEVARQQAQDRKICQEAGIPYPSVNPAEFAGNDDENQQLNQAMNVTL